MYCRNCHKQSPENFVNCVYCGAKLNEPKKKVPNAFVKKKELKGNPSLKSLIVALLVFAFVISIAAIFTATVTGSKPDKIVKNFVSSIQNTDEKLYYSLFDEGIKEYKKENRYFGDEETFQNIVTPLHESDEFYKEKCGKDYKLSYSITSSTVLTEDDLIEFSACLENSFSYIKLPTRVEVLNVEIIAKGEKGEYKSIYNDFWCMKIKGRWYKIDKTVYTEYEKTKLVS